MRMRSPVLARLAWKFSQHPETVATEALGHILSESSAARDGLESFLHSHDAHVGRLLRAQTEVTGEEGERSDLACFDQRGRERLLIEVKFWARLTRNQPVTYLERLSEGVPSTLLVVAPSKRIETLWPELKRRVREGMRVELAHEEAESEVRRATVGIDRRLVLASWRVLLEKLESKSSGAGDMQAVNDIRQLAGLTELQDTEEFLPLRPEQLDAEFARLVLQLNQLVDDASARSFAAPWASRGRMQKRWEGGPFQYMLLGDCAVWFGVKFEFWSRYERTPLWLGFQTSALEERIPQELQRRWDDLRSLEQSWDENAPESLSIDSVVPIDLLTAYEYHQVLDDVVGQLQDLAGAFQEIYTTDSETQADAGE